MHEIFHGYMTFARGIYQQAVIAQPEFSGALARSKLGGWRQESPVKRLLPLEHVKKPCARLGFRFPGCRKVGRILQHPAGCDFETASAAYRQEAFHAGHAVRPDGARYSQKMREFILPYAAVRNSSAPDEALLQFCQTTYDAGQLTSPTGIVPAWIERPRSGRDATRLIVKSDRRNFRFCR